MTAYGGGLRVSEVVHLRPTDIHSDRMLIRVNQGKGRKDRYTLLSSRLLEELRAYWRQIPPEEGMVVPGLTATSLCRRGQRKRLLRGQRTGGICTDMVSIACDIRLPRT